jgi:hypothetical protein
MSNTVYVTVSETKDGDYIIAARDSYCRSFIIVNANYYQDNAKWIMMMVQSMREFDDMYLYRYAYKIETPTNRFEGKYPEES